MNEPLLDINKLSIIKNAYIRFIKTQAHDDEFLSSYAIFLEAIYNNEFHSQQELSAFIGCNKAHTSRTLVKMKIKGFLKILPPPKDKIELTEKGIDFAKKFIQTKREFLEHLMKNITKEEKEVFARTFDRICLNAKNLEE